MIRLQFPKDRNVDGAFVAFAEKMLTDAGVTQAQADHIATAWQAHTDQWLQADASKAEAAREQEVAVLRSQWGGQFDGHIAAGRKAASSLGLDAKALDALDRTLGVGATMGLLAKIGSRVSTDTNTGVSKINITDPAAARAEIARLSGDRTFQGTLRDTKNPTARQDALTRWNDLHAAAFPAPEAAPASSPQFTGALADKNTPSKSAAALTRLDQLKADPAFMDSVFDKQHASHETNKATWIALQGEAYAEEGGTQ